MGCQTGAEVFHLLGVFVKFTSMSAKHFSLSEHQPLYRCQSSAEVLLQPCFLSRLLVTGSSPSESLEDPRLAACLLVDMAGREVR